jgi:hypothetical protein
MSEHWLWLGSFTPPFPVELDSTHSPAGGTWPQVGTALLVEGHWLDRHSKELEGRTLEITPSSAPPPHQAGTL